MEASSRFGYFRIIMSTTSGFFGEVILLGVGKFSDAFLSSLIFRLRLAGFFKLFDKVLLLSFLAVLLDLRLPFPNSSVFCGVAIPPSQFSSNPLSHKSNRLLLQSS